MHEITIHRSHLGPLFEGHRHLAAIREAVLEDRLGRVWGNRSEEPEAARIDLGCYAIFGGDPRAPGVDELLQRVEVPMEFVYPDDAWRRRILEVHGDLVRDRPMDSFSGARLDAAHLRGMVEALPREYTVEWLDVDTAGQIDKGLLPHGLQTYPSPEVLVQEGMAWGALTRDPSPRLACVASSYALSSRSVEVAISTREDHRGRGLAGAVAARFCIAALERGIEPCWNASNPVSKRLAVRLGFVPAGECAILFLER
jgi:GNAT superfamily N-acetyltransferase